MSNKRPSFLKSQSFTLALIGAVAIAAFIPEIGIKGGPLKTEYTTKIAIFLTFVIQGLSLPTRHIAASATKLRLHAFCQCTTFLAAPILMVGLLLVVGDWVHPGIKAGFFYLAALPTTITSAIVMTTNSEGDSSAALFSTTLSNVLGIFITPFLCSLLIASSFETAPPLSTLIAKLSMLVLLPLVVGQLIRPLLRDWANASKVLFKRLCNSFIVFIVFAAFCQSVSNGVWVQVGFTDVAITILLTTLFLVIYSGLVWVSTPIASKEMPGRITAFFCGFHKTLAAGVPMAAVLFSNIPADSSLSIGLVILPIMCYHPLQLVLSGLLSPLFARLAKSH